METLVLNYEDVNNVFSTTDCLVAVEEAFKSLGEGKAENPVAIWHKMSGDQPMIGLLVGTEEKKNILAVKSLAVNWDNPKKRQMHHTQGIIMLCDAVSGFPLALIEGIIISYARTGADAAVAAKYLARNDFRNVGVMGARDMARYFLRCMHVLFPKIEKVLVYSKTPANTAKYASDMNRLLGLDVQPFSTPQEVVKGSEVIMTGTRSTEPLIQNEWVNPGTHISWMGVKTELDYNILNRSIVVSTIRDQSKIAEAISKKEITPQVYTDIGEIVTGKKPGRTSPDQTTVYDGQGSGILDAVVSQLVFEAAKRSNLGKWVDLHKGAPAW